MTNTAGDTFIQCSGAQSTANNLTDIWYVSSTGGNASDVVTANYNFTTAHQAIIVLEYSGQAASPFEVAQNGGASSTTVTSGSFSPAASGNLNAAIGSQAVGGSTWTAGTNYTLEANTGGGSDVEAEDRVGAPSGAQTASITYNASSGMDISVASFKPAASGNGGSTILGPSKLEGPSFIQ